MNYLILMDVSGDVDPSIAKQNNLQFISMEYSIGNQMRTCAGIEPDDILKEFYDGQRNGDLTKTSQISPFQYEEAVGPLMAEGNSILYLCLSSGLSSTFQSANVAKKALEEKYPGQAFIPVDTLAATGGMGVLAERAFRNREAGMSIEDNAADLVEATHHIRHWFIVQDLMYLKRGGRVSAASAIIGSALNVRPVLKIDEIGKLINIDKKRGNTKALKELLARYEETKAANHDDVIYVIDADAPDLGDWLEAELKKGDPSLTIRRRTLSPIIGAHTGPGMAAICHMGR